MSAGLRLSSHRPQWEEFSELIERLEVEGSKSLSPPEKRRMLHLFDLVESDLALARQQGDNPQLEAMLNRLLVRAQPWLEPAEPAEAGGFGEVARDFATALRENWGYVLVAATVLFGSAALAAFQYHFFPETLSQLFPVEMIGEYEARLAEARANQVRQGPELALAASIPEQVRFEASQMIMWNNIRVTFLAFALGLAMGWLGYLVLIQNGLMIGALAAVYFEYGYGAYFTAGIAPHGLVELTCICLGSGAGIALGHSWLFSGDLPRGTAFRKKGREILPLLIGAAVLLVPTGFIEGFVTPARLPGVDLEQLFLFKTVFGVVWLVIVMAGIWYFGWGAGARRSEGYDG